MILSTGKASVIAAEKTEMTITTGAYDFLLVPQRGLITTIAAWHIV
jgi:hypothetical protein